MTYPICKIELTGDNFKFSVAIKSEKELEMIEFFIKSIRENLKETKEK